MSHKLYIIFFIGYKQLIFKEKHLYEIFKKPFFSCFHQKACNGF